MIIFDIIFVLSKPIVILCTVPSSNW